MPGTSLVAVLQGYARTVKMGGAGSRTQLRLDLKRVRKRSIVVFWLAAATVVAIFCFGGYLAIKFGDPKWFTSVLAGEGVICAALIALMSGALKEANGTDYLLALSTDGSDSETAEIVRTILKNKFGEAE